MPLCDETGTKRKNSNKLKRGRVQGEPMDRIGRVAGVSVCGGDESTASAAMESVKGASNERAGREGEDGV